MKGRGKSIYPAPVACASFVGGETIRMSFWQPAGKPWRFAAARRLLAQVIGNERARSARTATIDAIKISKVTALATRPGTEGEKAAAEAALKRIKKRAAKDIMARLAAKIEALPQTNGHPPATDFVSFWIEHDGERYDEASLPPPKPKRVRSVVVSVPAVVPTQPALNDLAQMMIAMERELGDAFLDTKAWRRVRARVVALKRADKQLAA